MSKTTIAKFTAFVIWAAFAGGCDVASSGMPAQDSPYQPPKVVGTIKTKEIRESSGLAASRCSPGVLWTHNDSGDDAFIFAINLKGEVLGTWKVQNAENDDWEDMATYKDSAGKCWLYIGEIGDNKLQKAERTVYRVPEPSVTASTGSTKKDPLAAPGTEAMNFIYPDGSHNAETLMVHPKTGDIYVLTKMVTGPAEIYRIKPAFGSGQAQKAEHLGSISVPAIPNGLLTGGDISPDGRRVILCDYGQAFELALPDGVEQFDAVWKVTPVGVELGKRKNGETVCYSPDGMTLYATSERKDSPVIEVRRK